MQTTFLDAAFVLLNSHVNKFPWSEESKFTFWYWNQTATCPPAYKPKLYYNTLYPFGHWSVFD